MVAPDPASLKIWPDCRTCILGMIQDALDTLQENDPAIEQEIARYADGIFQKSYQEGWSSPVTANKILRKVKRLTGVADPYASFKKKEVKQAKQIFAQIQKSATGDLRSSVVLSVLGNSLDFFTDPDKVLLELPDTLQKGVDFYYDDIDRLDRFLSNSPETVLFFTDNTGEVFFDIPFFHYIQNHARRTVLVVKGAPSLNDLSTLEVKAENLSQYFDNIADTGTDGVGIDWEETSPEFRHLVRAADLIVSKGMANFETLYSKSLSAPVFFLLKAKCHSMQDFLSAPANSYCAIWKQGSL